MRTLPGYLSDTRCPLTAPPPDIINEKEEYEIEEIRGYHKKRRGTQFLVYWKGYGNEYDQ